MSLLDDQQRLALRMETLECYLASFEDSSDTSLARLSAIDHPDAVRRRLAILIDADRFADAADVVRHLEPHERWVDRAITVLIQNGEADRATQLFAWAKRQSNLNIGRRCAIAMADARQARAFRERDRSKHILPRDVTNAERVELEQALVPLSGLLTAVLESSVVRTEYESLAAQIALRIYALLGKQEERKQLGALLPTRRPIPYLVLDLVHERLIDPPADLPARLRNEHPNEFRSAVVACLIEADYQGKGAQAFDSLMRLLEAFKGAKERAEIVRALYNVAQQLGPDALRRVREVAPAVLKSDVAFLSLLEADDLLRSGKAADAAALLQTSSNEEDPNWLQLFANCLLQEGRDQEAADAMLRAARLFPDPDVLRKAASLTYQCERFLDSAEAIETLLKLRPQDVEARQNLTLIYQKLGDFRRAAEHFAVLRSLEPEVSRHGVNHAASLFLSGDLTGSLRAYEDACRGTDAPLSAFLGRAQVLKVKGQPKDAFTILFEKKDAFWERPEYVLSLLDVSYAAGREDVAHEAFTQLRSLQSAGKAPADVLQEKTLDDLVGHIKEHRDEVESLQRATIEGKCTWGFVDAVTGYTSYFGWLIRTQSLNWVFDDPVNRAAFCIYSTNNFSVFTKGTGARQLDEVCCPPAGTTVVADLSSLLTLDRLGLLGHAASYFGKILLPSAYLPHVLNESGKLGFHQLSRKTAAEALKAALDNGRLATLAPEAAEIPHVHEHTSDEESGHFYRLRDVIAPLHEAGLISDAKQQELLQVAHRPSGVDGTHSALTIGSEVRFELSTLRTLSVTELLETVLRHFRVGISQKDRTEVIEEAQAVSTQATVRRWHDGLWDKIRGDARFVQTAGAAIPQLKAQEAMTEDEEDAEGPSSVPISLAAPLSASDLELPLLADDRVCQALALNTRPTDPHGAFGTDRLILALQGAGLIDAEMAADALLRLIEWRYRFIVLPPEVLLTLAKRFSSHPPGSPLRRVSLYLHDCMRDAGLLAGVEPSDAPTTIAIRLYLEWNASIAEFVMDIWQESTFNDESATKLTRWVTSELLPSAPLSMREKGAALAAMSPRYVISRALIKSVGMTDRARANAALLLLAEGLGMSQEEYLSVVAEVLDEI